MMGWEAVKARLAELEESGFVSAQGQDDIRAALERVEELEREVIRKDNGYTAIIKMERDARDQFRERAEAAEAKLVRCVEAASDVAEGAWWRVDAALAAAKGSEK